MREGKNMGIMTTFKKPTLESPLPLEERVKEGIAKKEILIPTLSSLSR